MKALLVVPVHNEERKLRRCVKLIFAYLSELSDYDCDVVVANNASTDKTLTIAHELRKRYPALLIRHFDIKGRGHALKHVWLNDSAHADILAYTDVDLSTDLNALKPLLDSLASGQHDIAIGSRSHPGSKVSRGWRRRSTSRVWNRLVDLLFGIGINDTQCGFKAIRRDVAVDLLPAVRDTQWVFDTELLILAKAEGFRVAEIPVRWVDNPDSRVSVFSAAVRSLSSLSLLKYRLATLRSSTKRPRRPAKAG